MARIRSIHPGIWTDEDFAGLSMAARVLYFGILTEADDHGVFEWKPTGLKMRIFPADKISVEPLLNELISADKVSRVNIDGRDYGLVRNFCKYQRPKKPTYRHLLPDDYRTYVGLSDDSSELVENQFGTGTEILPQRKEEGGRRDKEKKEDSAPDGAAAPTKYVFESGVIRLNQRDFDQWREAYEQLDLRAELLSMTEWAGQQAKWFHAVQGLLGKRNREAKAAAKQRSSEPAFKWNGQEGVI
jgi:hypothetical protein